ncbi:MAG: acetylornithine aminotransferase [Thelocarpon superellum]|nr:MAG: acetylornithine aminotransferase [Thelocarpon superellum]
MFVKGEGCWLWDVENRQYLDFTSGIAVNALGHCDPEMGRLLAQQVSPSAQMARISLMNKAKTLIHTSNLYHNPWTGTLSKLLVEKTREAGGMSTASRVFICNSGSEANEAALKFARKVGKELEPNGSKHEIVSFTNSFHGRTFGSLSATPNPKYQAPFAPMLPGFRYGKYNDVDDARLSDLITPQTCGVIVEPIQGEGGVNVATSAFLSALRARCTAVGAVLIYDEIQSGLARTGQLWAHQLAPASTHPDILTTAKALGNGYPIGATIVSEAVASHIATGDHGTTFGGNPLGSRLAHYIVTRLSEPELQASVRRKSALIRSHIASLRATYPDLITADVRGAGLLLGVQLSHDPALLLTAARERGLLLITCGVNTLRLVPPLIISEEEIETAMAILKESMRVVFGEGSTA